MILILMLILIFFTALGVSLQYGNKRYAMACAFTFGLGWECALLLTMVAS